MTEFHKGDLRELKRDLKALRLENLLKGELDPMGQRVVNKVDDYPPPLPTSRRTGFLGRNWMYDVMPMDLEVENLAWYAGYVQGEQQTARHRQTGWKRLFNVFNTEADKLIKRLSDKAGRIWRT